MSNIKTTNKYINLALQCAQNSPFKHKCGAVLVYRNTVISTGYNQYKSNIGLNIKQCVL